MTPDSLEKEVAELRELLHDFFQYAAPKLSDKGHGSTYYFHDLNPKLFARITKKLSEAP